MDNLVSALAEMGLAWQDVWVLTADRRAGTLVVVAASGQKFSGALETQPATGGKQPSGAKESPKTDGGQGYPGDRKTDGH